MANNMDYQVSVKVVLDTSGVQSQVKNIGGTVSKGITQSSKGWLDQVTYQQAQMIARTALTAVQAMIDEVRTLDASITEFKKVSDLTGTALDGYVTKLGEIGRETARTTAEMVDAATQFKKSGYTEEDSATLAKTATMFQNIADSQLSASDASTFLISQMVAFGIEAENSIHIIDAINEVSNNYAVSSTDVSSALSKTSSAMVVLGNSFEQTIGLVTSGGEILQGQAGKVARGLVA